MATKADPSSLTVDITGTIDPQAASRLGERVAHAQESRVVLDFSRASVADAALIVLADAIQAASGQLSLRGLGRHQVRVLRYLGIDVTGFEVAHA